jgi:hypothetical protein
VSDEEFLTATIAPECSHLLEASRLLAATLFDCYRTHVLIFRSVAICLIRAAIYSGVPFGGIGSVLWHKSYLADREQSSEYRDAYFGRHSQGAGDGARTRPATPAHLDVKCDGSLLFPKAPGPHRAYLTRARGL